MSTPLKKAIARSLGAVIVAALTGCASQRTVSPGANGLAPEQSAWLITHDDVKIVSLDGVSSGYQRMDGFSDGIGMIVQIAPGHHDLEVIYNNGAVSSAARTQLPIEARVGKVYYVRNAVWGGIRYGMFQFDGPPNEALMKHLQVNALRPEMDW